MRISDWSSDVCSSDLHRAGNDDPKRQSARHQRGTIDLPPIPEAAVSNPPANLQRLLDIMARLRDRENGCPWDIEQTFATIAPYTIEEAYEVADEIDRADLHETDANSGAVGQRGEVRVGLGGTRSQKKKR